MSVKETENGVSIRIDFPLPEERVFRNQAFEDILELLINSPHSEFGIGELRRITGRGGESVDIAVRLLESLDLVKIRREGRKRLVILNRHRIDIPGDPVMRVPQEEFREPVKAFLDRLEENRDIAPEAVILFGSVARGEADRSSDIDLLVIIEDDLQASRRAVQDIRQRLEERKFGGERYEFQVMVESYESALNHGEKLEKIFKEGIELKSSDTLPDLKEGVLDG